MFFSLDARVPVSIDAASIITHVSGYPVSYVCKVNLGSVRKKFIRTTLTSEPATLQIYPLVNIEIKSTHRRYTIVTFDSVNPIYISSIPITVAILKKPIVIKNSFTSFSMSFPL